MAAENGTGGESPKGERLWIVEAPLFEDEDGDIVFGDIDRNQATQTAVDVNTVVLMVGGVASCVAQRVEVSPGEYRTRRLIFKWHSYAPAAKLPPAAVDEPPAEEPDLEPDEVVEPARAA